MVIVGAKKVLKESKLFSDTNNSAVSKKSGSPSRPLEGLSYRERIDRLAVLSLEQRRPRGDPILVYKISGTDKMDCHNLFPLRVW